MEHNFIENQLIILTKQTLDIFLQQDNPSEIISLYTFYYYTAKWQGTNQPKCTTSYVANALHWGENKVRKVKKQLIDFGLIEDAQTRNEYNKITGHYVKMNYIFKKETIEKAIDKSHPHDFAQGGNNNKSHPHDFAQGGNDHRVDDRGSNALSDNNLNALSSNNSNALGRKKVRKKESEIDINFENLWKLLKAHPNDRKSKVTKKRKKELYEMGYERVEKAINLYLKIQNPEYYHKRDNILNEIIDNYIDKTEKDFNVEVEEHTASYDISEYEKQTESIPTNTNNQVDTNSKDTSGYDWYEIDMKPGEDDYLSKKLAELRKKPEKAIGF